jgi:hypothetical protein
MKCKRCEAKMNKPELQSERPSVAASTPIATSVIFEVRNITMKEAIQLVRSLATASRSPQQTESDHSQ